MEDKAGATYENLLAIRQLDDDTAKPKQKRARMNPKKTPTQSTKEFLAAMDAQAAESASTAADGATDVVATAQEVLGQSMESATSAEVTMSCLMLAVEPGQGGARANPNLPP